METRQVTPAVARERRRAVRQELRRECVCGKPFAVHGALPPHTVGDECQGFKLIASGARPSPVRKAKR